MIPKTRTVATGVGALILAGASAWGCGDGPGREPEVVRRVTVPTGTRLRVALSRELDARTAAAGERFHARVLEGVVASGRRVLVPPGAVVRGRVVAVRESDGAAMTRVLHLCLETIRVRGESPVLAARIVEVRPRIRPGAGTDDRVPALRDRAAPVARIGALVGGGSSDASMGTGVVLGTPAADAILPRGSEMRIELNEPLRVRMP